MGKCDRRVRLLGPGLGHEAPMFVNLINATQVPRVLRRSGPRSSQCRGTRPVAMASVRTRHEIRPIRRGRSRQPNDIHWGSRAPVWPVSPPPRADAVPNMRAMTGNLSVTEILAL